MDDLQLHSHLIGQQGSRAALNTPVLVLDRDQLDANIAVMQTLAAAQGLEERLDGLRAALEGRAQRVRQVDLVDLASLDELAHLLDAARHLGLAEGRRPRACRPGCGAARAWVRRGVLPGLGVVEDRPDRERAPRWQGLDGQAGVEPGGGLVGDPADYPAALLCHFMGGVEQARDLRGVVCNEPAPGLPQAQALASLTGLLGGEVHQGGGRPGQLVKHVDPASAR